MSTQKKSFNWLQGLNLALFGALLGLFFVLRQWPDNQLHLITCDIGQGDGILVVFQDRQIVIDGGPDDSILDCLSQHMPFWDKTIDALVMTHPQADHMTGFIEVVNRYQVGVLFAPFIANDIDQFWILQEAILAQNIPVKELLAGDKFRLGEVMFTVLWPQDSGGNQLAWVSVESNEKVLGAQSVADPNLFSTVLLGEFGRSRFLLTGDIDQKIESELISAGLGQVEVLKVAHHGSKYSSSANFLQAVKPKLALVSVGKNRFGHPTAEAIERLKNAGAKVLRSDELGSIELISNGTSWWQN
jgi:competence protein ComEC